MNPWLLVAALLTFGVGLAHSCLGERYVLTRLFRRTALPKLMGSEGAMRRVLRFAWHLTTVAWWGFGALLVLFAMEGRFDSRRPTLLVVAGTFAVSAAITGFTSRGRHLAWMVFLAIAAIAWWAA
jgi:hypothetical protein